MNASVISGPGISNLLEARALPYVPSLDWRNVECITTTKGPNLQGFTQGQKIGPPLQLVLAPNSEPHFVDFVGDAY